MVWCYSNSLDLSNTASFQCSSVWKFMYYISFHSVTTPFLDGWSFKNLTTGEKRKSDLQGTYPCIKNKFIHPWMNICISSTTPSYRPSTMCVHNLYSIPSAVCKSVSAQNVSFSCYRHNRKFWAIDSILSLLAQVWDCDDSNWSWLLHRNVLLQRWENEIKVVRTWCVWSFRAHHTIGAVSILGSICLSAWACFSNLLISNDICGNFAVAL